MMNGTSSKSHPTPQQREVYLDNNATTHPLPEVVGAVVSAMTDAVGNPSSAHQSGTRGRNAIRLAREQVAGLVAAQPEDAGKEERQRAVGGEELPPEEKKDHGSARQKHDQGDAGSRHHRNDDGACIHPGIESNAMRRAI